MGKELTHFLKDHVCVKELYRDINFLPRNDMSNEPSNNLVVGVYGGVEWQYIDGESRYVKPVNGQRPTIHPRDR